MNRAIVPVGVVVALLSAAPAQAAIDSFFDVFVDITQGPPYPTPPVRVHVASGDVNGDGIADTMTHDVSMGLRTVSLNGLPPGEPVIGTLSVVEGDGGPDGSGGVAYRSAFFDVFTELDFDTSAGRFRPAFFDVFADFSDIGTGARLIGTPSALYAVDSFFDVFVELELPNGETQTHQIHGQCAPGVTLNVGMTGTSFHIDSFFDIFTELHFAPDYVPDGAPLRMTMTGTATPAPGALALLGLAGLSAVKRRR
jgi:hypothetical protein